MLAFGVDLLSLAISTVLVKLLFGTILRLIPAYTVSDYVQFYSMLAVAVLITFSCFNQKVDLVRRNMKSELLRVVEYNTILAAVLAILLIVTKASVADSRYLYLGIFLVNAAVTTAARGILRAYLRSGHSLPMKKLVGVLSTRDRVEPLVRDLHRDWSKNVIGMALVDAEQQDIGTLVEGVPVKARFEDFMEWVRRDALDEIYISLPGDTSESLMGYLTEMESMGLDIHFNIPQLDRLREMQNRTGLPPRAPSGMVTVGGVSMITVESVQYSMRDLMLKRAMDLAGALVGCLISVPIIAVVAIPLKLESPGPLFFRQQRVGLNGRIFNMYKLRSRYVDAEERKKELMDRNEMNGLMFKMENDPRIIGSGADGSKHGLGWFIRKTSLDEFPQFWNVLKGDMSLVGTRPPTVDEWKQYEPYHRGRLAVKPGLTGMWQVSGRSDITDFEEVVKLDMEYVKNWNIGMDIKILFKTVGVVLKGSGSK